MHFLSSQDPDKKKTPTTKLLASEIAAGVSSYSFFFSSLIYFSLNQKVTGMYSVCAKFCAGHSDTKMGRTKSRAQDAQNVVGGADEETSQ